jgi:hypothetical protein
MDIYHLKTLKPDSIEAAIQSLPATCAAIVCILKKNDCVASNIEGSTFLFDARQFSEQLPSIGYPNAKAEITQETINTQELRVLQTLGWRIQVPTAETWSSAFTARFNVLTKSLLTPSLTWVWQQSLFGSSYIMMRKAVNLELPPRALAIGLLAIGLVGARLLPLQVIQPPDMSIEEWHTLYLEIQPQQRPEQLECMLPTQHSTCLMELFRLTVGGVDLTEITEYSRLSALTMRSALQEELSLSTTL